MSGSSGGSSGLGLAVAKGCIEEAVKGFFMEEEPFDHLVISAAETEFGPFLSME